RHDLLDPFGLVAARLLELVERPRGPVLVEVGPVAEEELLVLLAAERRELGADARLALHAGDVVAAGAAELPDELLARRDVRGIREARLERIVRRLLRAERHEIRGDRRGLVVGEPEARH